MTIGSRSLMNIDVNIRKIFIQEPKITYRHVDDYQLKTT